MNIPYFEECVKYALYMKGIAGDAFNNTGMRVYERVTTNPSILFTTLEKGGIAIPVVKSSLLGEYEVEVVATVVVKVSQITDMVELYVPTYSDIRAFPIAVFVEAWEMTGGICITAFSSDDKTYRPMLLDLKHIELPEDIEELREAIAENAHDMWALERQSEGWTYGPKRDDRILETPDMVPYVQLPESEKQYGRIMAEDTLKLIIALGYKLQRLSN